jgi:hypothetical protein
VGFRGLLQAVLYSLGGRRVGGPGLQGQAVGWVVRCRPGALTGRSWFGIGPYRGVCGRRASTSWMNWSR